MFLVKYSPNISTTAHFQCCQSLSYQFTTLQTVISTRHNFGHWPSMSKVQSLYPVQGQFFTVLSSVHHWNRKNELFLMQKELKRSMRTVMMQRLKQKRLMSTNRTELSTRKVNVQLTECCEKLTLTLLAPGYRF